MKRNFLTSVSAFALATSSMPRLACYRGQPNGAANGRRIH